SEHRPLLPEVPSPLHDALPICYTASGRHPANHAYLDRLTVPSDSIVWRPRRRPRTEARARRRDDHSGRLDITGPITEERVLINAQMSGLGAKLDSCAPDMSGPLLLR